MILFIEPEMRVATWRTGWPVAELRRRGYDAVLSASGKPAPELRGEVTVVFHVLNRSWVWPNGEIVSPLDLCKQIRRNATRLIVSFDDDLTQLLELEQGEPRVRAKMVHADMPEICKLASKIIVTTPRLAEVFGRWGEVAVVENYLPRWVLELKKSPREPRVMWMGHMAGKVHGRDWDLIRPYARALPPLTLVGTEPKAAEILNRWGAKDVRVVPGTVDQRKLYRMIGQAKAAIVPLVDTPFTRGKSWIKPMEFMARGVRPFTSAHREYDRLAELTGAFETFADPADLVASVAWNWENADGDGLPQRLLDTGLVMEQAGGDAWEKALL